MSPAAGDILFLAHRIPYPPDRGDKIRSFHIVKRLSEIARVHVCAFADDAADAANEAGLRGALGSGLASCHVDIRRRGKAASLLAGLARSRSASMAAFSIGSMRRAVAQVIHRREVTGIFAFSGQMSQYVPVNTDKRFVMDFVDVDSAKFESYAADAAPAMRGLYRREAVVLAREEAAIARRADVSLFVTEAEADLFRRRSGLNGGTVHVMGNGVDLSFFDPDADFMPLAAPPRPLLVFAGQMDYAPNVEAVTHFARETLPMIRARMPAAFAVVGRNPAPAVQALAALPGVKVVGAVPDMRPWLRAADVVVAPLRIARGVQNKVLEAMAMARPVVASPAAFEGIDAAQGRDLIVADGDEVAVSVLSLLADDALASRIGGAARARMCARYAWDRQLADLPALMFG